MGLWLHLKRVILVLILAITAAVLAEQVLAAVSATETPYVTTTDTELRTGPGAKYDVIQTIKKETRVSVVGKEAPWLKVQSKQGLQPGYIEERTARPIAVARAGSENPVSGAGAYITTGEVNL